MYFRQLFIQSNFFPNPPPESEQLLHEVRGSDRQHLNVPFESPRFSRSSVTCATPATSATCIPTKVMDTQYENISYSHEEIPLTCPPSSPIYMNDSHVETEIPTSTPSQPVEPSEPQIIPTLKWIFRSRYDYIPENAISPGSTKNDGKVYVGRINIGPGKVNLDKGKVWNFWVQNTGSSQSGQVLVCDYQHKWVRIGRNEKIPENAVYSGKDRRDDHVWVGRSVDNEPGKITCVNNNERPLKMANLWCHSSWGSFQTAYILTVIGCKEHTYLKTLPSE